MSKRHQQGPQKQQPHHAWRAVRSRALGMRAPQSVRVLLDFLVETQALNRHLKLPRIKVGYGRHSEKEREWDRRKRDQLVAEGVPVRHLVQHPVQHKDGLAELCGMSRRTAIRAGRWMLTHGLVHHHHSNGRHPLDHRVPWLAGRGVGGCIEGGVGAATEWRPGAEPAPDPEPEPEPPTRPDAPRRSAAQLLAEARAGRPRPTPRPRGP